MKIFLGYAAGVGKTFAMLSELRRLKREGLDAVVGYFEPHGRKDTIALLDELEVIPRRKLRYRDTTFEEMDAEAILRRRPQICAVDEFAHTNVPGSVHAKRWEDVQLLLDAGIDVLTTMNVQHLESLHDQVWQISGIRVRETVPDWVVNQADEIVMTDLPIEALMNRLKRGVVYPPDKAQRALENFFKESTLDALRELALRQTAHEVGRRDAMQQEPLVAHWPEAPRETALPPGVPRHTERLLIHVNGDPTTAALIRRGRRVADFLQADCFALCVANDADFSGLPAAERETVLRHLNFARNLQIETRVVQGEDVATALVEFARRHQITQILVARPARAVGFLKPSLVQRVLRMARDIQLTVVAERRPDAAVASRRDPEDLLRRVEAEERLKRRGRLKVFLGYASGVGKTLRMLDEGRRRRERGEDVVVGATQPVTSPQALAVLQKLEVIPVKDADGVPVMDVEAILRRRPLVCVVDGLAYDNPPGSRNAHRWQDVEELLRAGISVIASVNLQYIEEQRPKVETITGKRVGHTIPQGILSSADEIELVDAPVEAERRAAIEEPEDGEPATPHPGDTGARISQLRQIALLVAADVVDHQLEAYLERHGLQASWGIEERILVSVTPQATGIRMIESGRRNADRFHGDLFVVHIRQPGLTPDQEFSLQANFNKARALGAQLEILNDEDWVEAILEFARTHRVTQIFVGHSMRETWSSRFFGTGLDHLIRKAESIDVRVFPQ